MVSSPQPKSARRLRNWWCVPTVLLAMLALSGCQTVSFYGQAIKGQYEIICHEEKITKLLADPNMPPALKARLELVERLRAFAEKDLKLPVDKQYTKYVDLHRRYVVWNVQAAPEFSLEAVTWWYPFVGSLDYRGYFSKDGAEDYAATLRKKGYDVYVDGVPAYSTLGWFKDPVLSTFLFYPEADLAETLFHELGHQRVFASGDTDFNEAFATTVGQEGARRWLRAQGNGTALDNYQAELQREVQFVHLISETRRRLEELYGDERTPEGTIRATQQKANVPREEMRRRKGKIIERLRGEYAQLKAEWGGNRAYDGWFAGPLNNAQLNTVATYFDLVPGFKRLLALNSGDLEKFYKAVQRLAKQPQAERHRYLLVLASTPS